MNEEEFQKQVLGKVGTIEEQNKKLFADLGNLDGSTKKALEEFTTLKNQFGSVESTMRAMQKLNQQLGLERRAAFGTPAQRIACDEVKRKTFVLNLIKSLELGQFLSTKQREKWAGIEKDLDTANTPGSTYISNAEVEDDIYTVLASYGVFNQFDVRRISSKATEVRVKTARIAATFIDEAAAITADSTKAGSKLTVTPGKIAALLAVSSELLEDDSTNLLIDILNDFAEAAAYKMDFICLAADGGADATDGGFTGILGGGGTDRTAASGNTTMATLDYEDVLACVINAPNGVIQRGGAAWWMNPTILAKMLLIKDTTGRALFQSALEAPSYGKIGSILGFPVNPAAAAPTTDSAGARVAAFGDPNALAVRIRRDMQISRSDQWAFDTDEIAFRMTMRGGIKIKAATAFQVLKTAAS
jgi:HK97 family phage major capsid protein